MLVFLKAFHMRPLKLKLFFWGKRSVKRNGPLNVNRERIQIKRGNFPFIPIDDQFLVISNNNNEEEKAK